jgi:hypothetical protein
MLSSNRCWRAPDMTGYSRCGAKLLLCLSWPTSCWCAGPGHARDLIEQAASPSTAALFQRDVENKYNISVERALERFGFPLAPCVNSGIALFPRDAVNLARCEYYLSDEEVACPNTMVEQTLYALAFSERSEIEYLPDSYLVSLKPCADMHNLVARHYAGASRSLFTHEGLPALIEAGLFTKLNGPNWIATVDGTKAEA